MVYVTKASGERAEFEKGKIIRTCERAGVPSEIAQKIACEVEQKAYNGISTSKIMKFVLSKLEDYEAHHSLKYDLRQALANLSPEGYEFEHYIEHLLQAHNYKTQYNVIVKGECIEHQIDVIAEKDGRKYLVECKHHTNPHRFCGLEVPLQVWAVLEDIKNVSKEFENSWIVCNTKFSEHAIRYAEAKGLLLTGWSYPYGKDLQSFIEKKGLYPITILGLDKEMRIKFSDAGILLLEELSKFSLEELQKKTRIGKRALEQLILKANEILVSF